VIFDLILLSFCLQSNNVKLYNWSCTAFVIVEPLDVHKSY